jgi:hypothetical protein
VIAKRVARDKASSSFGRLAEYIAEEEARPKEARPKEARPMGQPQEAGDPLIWAKAASSILDAENGGGRVGAMRVTNCVSEEPGFAAREIAETQKRNRRSKMDKTYHLVVSFPPGERPTPEQLRDIEDSLCAAIGLGDHQRLSAVHLDTACLHVHVAINKVHPTTFRNVEPRYDKRRLMQACRELELKHGLARANHGEPLKKTPRPQGAVEAEGFLRWIKEHAGEALAACRTDGHGWRELHAILAECNLEIRPRGAGLVIAERGGKLTVKASSVDRGLSMKALTSQWGAYAPPTETEERIEAKHRYGGAAPQGGALYAEYQRQRETAIVARKAALSELRGKHETYAQDLRAWHGERRQALQNDPALRGAAKRKVRQELAARRREDFERRRAREAEQAGAVKRAHLIPSWREFLEAAAASGDGEALTLLRRLLRRQQRAASALLTAANPDAARDVVFSELRPHTRRNGHVVYRVKDGGVVVDEVRQLRVEEPSAHAAFLALSLARERFAGQALIVEGDEQFKRQVTELAASQGVELRFADPAMEQRRQRLAADAANNKAAGQTAETSQPTGRGR